MKKKIKSWLKRYLPAEVGALAGVLLGGYIGNALFHNPLLTALGSSWGENMGYYGIIIYRDIKKLKKTHKKITFSVFIKLIRNLVLEFGPSQYLDSIIRPFSLYIFPLFLHNLYMGLIVGKYAADIIFYIPTIISFELKNKFLGE